jgi:GGDEF domain-containing protein
VSIGIACHDQYSPCASAAHEHCGPADLILAADSALYDAKRAGRAQSKIREIHEVIGAQRAAG